MKEITAIIQPIRLGPVTDALSSACVHGMTVSDARGFGSQGGSTDTYRGVEYRVEYVPKTRVEVVVTDDLADKAIEAILSAACTGHVGDGKVWVREGTAACRIRTGERDEVVVNQRVPAEGE
jgi:nitrogen regulatory protein P-II 1